MKIAILLPSHWETVRKIYEEGIARGNATFQTSAPTWEEWNTAHSLKPRLVAIDNDSVLGWAAITPVSGRCVYAGVGEVSVYISTEAKRKGIGKQLLEALIEESEKKNSGHYRPASSRKTWPVYPSILLAGFESLERKKRLVR